VSKLKISVITVSFNAAATIGETLRSVASQSYGNVEHIVVDGGSTDGTVEIIRRHEAGLARWVSEPDKGLYFAMNKGVGMATGDVIGVLNADDVYAGPDALAHVAEAFQMRGVDSCYADLVYVDKRRGGVVRRWTSGEYTKGMFRKGWHPPHPTFFVRREVYERHGVFDPKFRISADYEIMLRFLERRGVSTTYIPEVLVRMRTGGLSNQSLMAIVSANVECCRAWRRNGMAVPPLGMIWKPMSKLRQLWARRPKR